MVMVVGITVGVCSGDGEGGREAAGGWRRLAREMGVTHRTVYSALSVQRGPGLFTSSTRT